MDFARLSNQSVLGKVARWPLRMIPPDLEVRILQGPIRGYRWIAGSSTHGCWLGSYELPKQRLFAKLARQCRCVYDLGANVGFYSLLACGVIGKSGRVLAFEPAPRNVSILKRHLLLNKINNCDVFAHAVGASSGEISFDLGPNPSMGRMVVTSNTGIRVPLIALDDFVATHNLPAPDLIKCDIEGAEYDALRGAANLLAAHKPTILLATHGAEVHNNCIEFLEQIGYAVRILSSPDELLAIHPDRHLPR